MVVSAALQSLIVISESAVATSNPARNPLRVGKVLPLRLLPHSTRPVFVGWRHAQSLKIPARP
jgi:hypothetical protein